eukprot:s2601_g5.t1
MREEAAHETNPFRIVLLSVRIDDALWCQRNWSRAIFPAPAAGTAMQGRRRTLPIDDVFSLGKEAAQIVSDAFGAPVKMEFEKVYHPFLLMNKKRYAGLSFGSPQDAGKLDFKGIEVVRRDWCLLVRQMVERSLQLLLCERSKERAVEYVRETVASLRAGRIDYRPALVRAGAEEYAARQAHVELAVGLASASGSDCERRTLRTHQRWAKGCHTSSSPRATERTLATAPKIR